MSTAVPTARRATGGTDQPRSWPARMTPARKIALFGGIAYLVSFAASIPQLFLYADIVDDPAGFISSPAGTPV